MSCGERRLGVLLLAPALVMLAAVTLYPVARVLALSLERRVPIFGIADFVGLANYRFLAGDPEFRSSIVITLVFAVVSVALEVVLGVLAALLVRRQQRGIGISMSLLLLPWCLPGVVTARIFEWMYHPTAGLVTRLVAALGGPATANWLGDPRLALPALIAADVWRTMPLIALLAFARLGTIPGSVYEAAAVDGASTARAFRAITLPLLAPVLLVATLFRFLDALRAFDLIFVLTGGGPAGSTETLTVFAYRNLFQTLQLGVGSASAVVVFVLAAGTTWLYLRALTRSEEAT